MLPNDPTIATYGGAKEDAYPVEDPVTDESADDINEMKADVAAVARMGFHAARRFLGHATTPAEPASGFVHQAFWGNDNLYRPTVAKGGTGIYDVTWPATIVDELGVTKDVVVQGGVAQVESSAAFYGTSVEKTGARTLRIRIWQGGSTLNDAAGLPITVFMF